MKQYKEYTDSGGNNKLREKLIGDLSFTIYENWSLYGVYTGLLISLYLYPRNILEPLEILISYIVIIYAILMDFFMPKSIKEKILRITLISLTLHLNLKILEIDVVQLLVYKLFS